MFLKRRAGVSESAVHRCSWITVKIHRKKLVLESLFSKDAVQRTWNFIKEGSNTGVFLWILWIIQEHLFCRGSMNGFFWNTSAGSFFNKVASMTAWRHSTVLERQVFICEFCEIFRKVFFAEKFLATTSHMMLFFSFLQISEVCSLKSIYLSEQW